MQTVLYPSYVKDHIILQPLYEDMTAFGAGSSLVFVRA